VANGPDGALYVATSNRDGRGDTRPGDDRILRIVEAPPAAERPEAIPAFPAFRARRAGIR
jgi:hypothetical protein